MDSTGRIVHPHHRHLSDLVSQLGGDPQQLDIERESIKTLAREHLLGSLTAKALEPALRVSDFGHRRRPNHPIKDAPHRLPPPGLPHPHVGSGERPRPERHLRTLSHRAEQTLNLLDRRRQIGIRKQTIVTVGFEHPASDGVALPTVAPIIEHPQGRPVFTKALCLAQRRIHTAVHDDEHLAPVGLEIQVFTHPIQRGYDPGLLLEGGNHHAEMHRLVCHHGRLAQRAGARRPPWGR